jgi:hypothetical protein
MFCHCALIMYTFLAPMPSHVSLVIQHTPCSFVINYMTYILTKLEHQVQHSLPIEINLHTHKYFCVHFKQTYFWVVPLGTSHPNF